MDIDHIILGRPWEFENNTINDGFSNKITFSQNNKKYTLFPFSRFFKFFLKTIVKQLIETTIQHVDFPVSLENTFFQKNLNQATLDQIY